MTQTTDIGPWYRQPWFWFVMSPLIVVIGVSLTFVGISIFHADDRVVDNYYKQGRTINQSFEQEARARALNLAAEVEFDPVTGEVFLALSKDGPMPERLLLLIGHPVSAERDQRIVMNAVRDGYYRGDLAAPLSHRRYLTLLPEYPSDNLNAAEWLVRGEIHIDRSLTAQLRPNERRPAETGARP